MTTKSTTVETMRQAIGVETTESGTRVSVTIPAPILADAIGWVGHAAGKDDTLPTLTGILFTLTPVADSIAHPIGSDWAMTRPDVPKNGYVLELAATDRYRLAYATVVPTFVPIESTDHAAEQYGMPKDAVTALVPWRALQDAVKSWPKVRRGMPIPPAVTVTFESVDTVPSTRGVEGLGSWVTLAAGITGETAATARIRSLDGAFPQYRKLIPTSIGTGPGSVAVNPAYLGELARAADRFATDRHAPIRIGITGESVDSWGRKPVMIGTASAGHDGAWCSALLMPVRMAS